MNSSKRNCYCSIWDTNPTLLSSRGVPQGYCAFCDRCGQPGHLRHAPAPVPVTAGWCDECYEIERHRAPNIELGAWFYDARTGEQIGVSVSELTPEVLTRLASSLASARSSLVVGYPSGRWADLYVLADGSIEVGYADESKPKWAHGEVDIESAVEVVLCGLAGNDIEQVMRARGTDLEYYTE